jgi:hypothetical protein
MVSLSGSAAGEAEALGGEMVRLKTESKGG